MSEEYRENPITETMADAYVEEFEAEYSGLGYSDANMKSASSVNESSTEATGNVTERKLIRNISVSLETEKFDAVKNTIRSNIESLGGYIESSYEYLGDYYSSSNRNASITARIPAEKTDQFINTSFSDAYITSMNENTEDISLRYSDLKTKLETLETERDRLLDILKKTEDIKAIITIEEKLTDIRYELESIQSSLKSYDNQVTYSTVWIDISEVRRIEPTAKATFFERISDGFARSTENLLTGLEDIAVWFISNILSIVLFGAVVTGVVLIVKKICRNKKEETTGKESAENSSNNREQQQ